MPREGKRVEGLQKEEDNDNKKGYHQAWGTRRKYVKASLDNMT